MCAIGMLSRLHLAQRATLVAPDQEVCARRERDEVLITIVVDIEDQEAAGGGALDEHRGLPAVECEPDAAVLRAAGIDPVRYAALIKISEEWLCRIAGKQSSGLRLLLLRRSRVTRCR
jgi:hypothetical protein